MDRYDIGSCEVYDTEYKEFWENCEPKFAHIQDDYGIPTRFKAWVGWFDIGKKTILDYGCGGAQIAKVFTANPYIGVDIAERSLRKAKENLILLRPDNKPSWSLHQTPVELSELGADLLVAQQVINHFCNQQMLDEFLDNVNRSGIRELLLETKSVNIGDKTVFAPLYINGACCVGWIYLRKHLPRYHMDKCQPTGTYQFSKWTRSEYIRK